MQTKIPAGEFMKFVLNGRTFDTATSTKVAIHRGVTKPRYDNIAGDSEIRYEDTLYRTVKGAFFVHSHNTEKLVKGGKPLVNDGADELSPAAAGTWVIERGVAVLDATGLDLPEEA